MLAPAATLVVWTIARRGAHRQADGGRRRDGDRRRPRGGDAGGRLHQPDERASRSARIAAVPSYFAIHLRAKTSLDDSLDVVAAHGVGGTVGALLTGVFAQKALNGVADGVLFGNPRQFVIQGAAVLAAIVYSGVVSFVLLKLIGLVMPLRASAEEEASRARHHHARRRGLHAQRRHGHDYVR